MVTTRSPGPAAGRAAEPRRRVGSGGAALTGPPGRRWGDGLPTPAPGSLPSRSRPFLFPAEKRPKAGAESREAGAGVQVELQGSELWKRFHDIGTEMIITKAGRYWPHPALFFLCLVFIPFYSFFFSFFLFFSLFFFPPIWLCCGPFVVVVYFFPCFFVEFYFFPPMPV